MRCTRSSHLRAAGCSATPPAGGHSIARQHVATLMKKMAIEAIYRRPNTSKAFLSKCVLGAAIFGIVFDHCVERDEELSHGGKNWGPATCLPLTASPTRLPRIEKLALLSVTLLVQSGFNSESMTLNHAPRRTNNRNISHNPHNSYGAGAMLRHLILQAELSATQH